MKITIIDVATMLRLGLNLQANMVRALLNTVPQEPLYILSKTITKLSQINKFLIFLKLKK